MNASSYEDPYRIDLAKQIPSPGPGAEVSTDCLLYYMLITNPTDSTAIISVFDGQDEPIYLIAPDELQANGWIAFSDERGMLMPGGFSWSSSVPGVHGRALLSK